MTEAKDNFNILVVSRSPGFTAGVSASLANKGFDPPEIVICEMADGLDIKPLSQHRRGTTTVHVVDNFALARDILSQTRPGRHIDCDAVFLESDLPVEPVNLPPPESNLELALMALDPGNQPRIPRLYSIGPDAHDMRDDIVARVAPRSRNWVTSQITTCPDLSAAYRSALPIEPVRTVEVQALSAAIPSALRR